MHLCVIKKANLTADVSPTDAPKIYEIFQSLTNVTENKTMYALLCFLVREGCPIESNYKGAKVLDWIQCPQMKELIQSFEKNHNPGTSNPSDRSLNSSREDDNEAIINQLCSNSAAITSANDSGASTVDEVEPSPSGSSNPPTPARRNRQLNREIATPSPQNMLPMSEEDAKRTNNDSINEMPNSSGRYQSPNRTLSPPNAGAVNR
jgi:E3 ubiquitin-protein ligase mind-bomb